MFLLLLGGTDSFSFSLSHSPGYFPFWYIFITCPLISSFLDSFTFQIMKKVEDSSPAAPSHPWSERLAAVEGQDSKNAVFDSLIKNLSDADIAALIPDAKAVDALIEVHKSLHSILAIKKHLEKRLIDVDWHLSEEMKTSAAKLDYDRLHDKLQTIKSEAKKKVDKIKDALYMLNIDSELVTLHNKPINVSGRLGPMQLVWVGQPKRQISMAWDGENTAMIESFVHEPQIKEVEGSIINHCLIWSPNGESNWYAAGFAPEPESRIAMK